MKYAYIHIPKTGGTYVKSTLTINDNFIPVDELFPPVGKLRPGANDVMPSTVKKFSGLLNRYLADPECFIFSTVRNPFDLLVTYWYSGFQTSPNRGNLVSFVDIGEKEWKEMLSRQVARIYKNKKGKSRASRTVTFPEFLDEFISMSDKCNSEYFQHYQSSCLYYQLLDKKGDLMTDYVLRQENLTEDLKSFCAHHGLQQLGPHQVHKGVQGPPFDINRMRHSRSKDDLDYRKFYDNDSRKKVEKHFKDDLDMFGYSF